MQRRIMLAPSAAAALLGATLAAKATTLPGPNTGAAMNRQSKCDNAGCPSFHEVHPSMMAKETLRARTPTGFKLYPSFDPPDETLDETLLVRESRSARESRSGTSSPDAPASQSDCPPLLIGASCGAD